MRTYAINLKRSSERRRHIESELSRAGHDYTMLDAVDGPMLSAADRVGLVDEAAVARYPHWLTPGMIGCTLSHHLALGAALEDGGEMALIVEDDVCFEGGLGEILDALEARLSGAEVVLLYYRSHRPLRMSTAGSEALGSARLMYPVDLGQPITTAAYVITREACERLREVMLPVRSSPDSWGTFHEEGAFDVLRCVVPRPVSVRSDLKSDIDYLGSGRLQRAMTSIHERGPGAVKAPLAWIRRLREARMSRIRMVSERSPLARARARYDGGG